MASFVLMEPTGAMAGDARLVRDGFSLFGFLVPPLWLVWHGLFAEAAVVLALMLGIAFGAEALGLGPVGSILSLLLSIYVGLEGSAMRIAGFTRRGWRQVNVLDAENLDEADIRYAVAGSREGERIEAPAAVTFGHSRSAARPTSGPALGLLSYPGS